MPAPNLGKGVLPSPVQRPVPLRESVYEALLDLIVRRKLPPGQHLVETELADWLGVSRQPVREALQRLSNEGWVDLRPGYGAFVHEPSESEAEQLLAVRALLETEAASLAAGNTGAEDIQQLRDLWRRGVAALERGDYDTVQDANAELHRLVTELSGNRVLADLAAQVARRVRWFYAFVVQYRGRESWDEHAQIIDAIATGDPESAGRLMREHTDATRRMYLAHASAQTSEEA
ncbi:DNA-binding GntR family transcriptional regulator [Lipingzhangella halophila]|uniref:DNA-binding GntR family transcriptional regulator n=1 Tax=Lipingzhangella halophila TaxID=1783352 RepID=A0A7W7W3P3_9ACTN|nr:GntR family transcriptional regulator [Lipingzhangella halophila]MBB4932728.1 DNA-binding GntR family transcriptional regulator [Lipingzhangella halophila]